MMHWQEDRMGACAELFRQLDNDAWRELQEARERAKNNAAGHGEVKGAEDVNGRANDSPKV